MSVRGRRTGDKWQFFLQAYKVKCCISSACYGCDLTWRVLLETVRKAVISMVDSRHVIAWDISYEVHDAEAACVATDLIHVT